MSSRPADAAARDFATDPARNVVLEASAGTGKTTVLVERYLRLLRAGVAPANVLAITFTRQAAAEMRERIVGALRRGAAKSAAERARWSALRDRLGEIAVSTVDAFCLALLREFPLEADLDPGFGVADETEIPGLIDEAVDRAWTAASHLAGRDSGVAMLLARLGPQRTRSALRSLLTHRLVVPGALRRFLRGTPADLTGERACRNAAAKLADRLSGLRREVETLTEADVVDDVRAAIVARDLRRLPEMAEADAPAIRAWFERLGETFLTRAGTPRRQFAWRTRAPGPAAHRRREAAAAVAPHVSEALQAFERDVNVVAVRAVRRVFAVAAAEYRRALRSRALLDFSDLLERAVRLLRRMDEFAQSRFRLESRYHHVLVDEFQDTNRAQWELVSLLVQSWGEGSGLVEEAPLRPTIFVVGDRKQSIYRFRGADVATFREATREIAGLRADGDVRRSISRSFRAAPPLLAFVNDLFAEIGGGEDGRGAGGRDRFRFEADDAFPIERAPAPDPAGAADALGVVAAQDVETCAEAVAAEIAWLLDAGQVRPKSGSAPRAVRPEDVAILFRTRESHREFERALGRRSIRTHVHSGMGFFDADEIKDVRALVRFLARPSSELRAAALLRSRFAGVSDAGLLTLAGALSDALAAPGLPASAAALGEDDRRVLDLARRALAGWIGLVDRLPPAEVLDRALQEAAYAFELRGPQAEQAQANIRRLRGLVRRIQNRGYATLARVADQIDRLSSGMPNAAVEAFDAVALMTAHAAKGLEFPIVFLVDLGRGTQTHQPPVRVIPDRGDGRPSVTVWPHRDEADAEERRREVEETKRLLYVATTRPRDRLYLSAVVEDGVPKFNPGSFGRVLPPQCASALAAAAGAPAGGSVEWRGRSGARHAFRVCGSPAEIGAGTGPAAAFDSVPAADAGPIPAPPPAPTLLAPLRVRPAVERIAVTDASPKTLAACGARADAAAGARRGQENGAPPLTGARSGREDAAPERRTQQVGRLVHRLLRRYEGAPVAPDALEQAARELAVDVETADPAADDEAAGFAADDVAAAGGAAPERTAGDERAASAARLYARFAAQEEVAALAGRDALWEVPFSLRLPAAASPAAGRPAVLRGAIDCLARDPDGRVTVLEFKTGAPHPDHRRQLDAYVAAARAMFPEAAVVGRLVYA